MNNKLRDKVYGVNIRKRPFPTFEVTVIVLVSIVIVIEAYRLI